MTVPYLVSDGTTSANQVYAEDLNQYANGLTGQRDLGALSLLQPLATPAAPTITTQSGAITGTAYQWGIYWISGVQDGTGTAHIVGRTPYGTLSGAQALTAKQATVSISGLTAPTGTIGWGVVRNKSSAGTWYKVPSSEQFLTGGSLPATFVDDVPDASLGSTAGPTTNTTGTTIQGASPTSGSSFPAVILPAGSQFLLQVGSSSIPFFSDGTHWYSEPVQSGYIVNATSSDIYYTKPLTGTPAGFYVSITDPVTAGCTIQVRAGGVFSLDGSTGTSQFDVGYTLGTIGGTSFGSFNGVTAGGVNVTNGTNNKNVITAWADGPTTGDLINVVPAWTQGGDAANATMNSGFVAVRFKK